MKFVAPPLHRKALHLQLAALTFDWKFTYIYFFDSIIQGSCGLTLLKSFQKYFICAYC